MKVQLIVLAKTPVPGRVKTRLCPPCTPVQAARLAAAALADTLDVVHATPAVRRVLVLDGELPGYDAVPQRGGPLGERLAAAFADTALPGVASFLVGMDTPQLTRVLLAGALRRLGTFDAVLGPAEDGGWWGLGLRDPRHAEVLAAVPMSTPETGALTLAALRARGLRVAALPELRDVDTIADAHEVARSIPASRFARALAATAVPVLA
jgi:rSAM/selenodomain-associated transferase 1